jgi:nucleoid-associated protein YgaU
MKFQKFLIMLLALSLVVGTKFTVFAQDDEEKKEEMTKEEWQKQIDEYTAKKSELTGKIADLLKDKDALTKTLDGKKSEVKKAEDDYYAAMGGKDKYDAYKTNLGKLETIVKNKEGKKEDADKMYADLGASNLRCHPDFAARYKKLGEDLKAWGPKVETPSGYTVVKGDCLYKIASKKEIYNNPKMWPVLWDANEKGVVSAPPKVAKTIKNPNLIYPGQVLKVPALTKDLEKMATDKAKKWRGHMHKRMVKKEEGTEKKDVKKDEKKDVKKDVKKEEKKDVKKEVKKEEKKDVKKDVKKEEKKETPKK